MLNLGGPLSQDDVYPFLFSLFSDPAILTLPNPLRYGLALLIARNRLKEAREIYAKLGGGSPLLKNTQSQALALEKELGNEYKVFIAMRHAPPFTETAFQEVKDYDPDAVVLLPLYPQYSTTTTESSFKEWKRLASGWKKPTFFIRSYPDQIGFIEAMTDLTLPHYNQAKKFGVPRLLLTAHGLPEKMIRNGDPYQNEVEKTAQKIIENIGMLEGNVILCYQSRVGPLKWVGPSTEEEILKAGRERLPLVVIPISFVSEHSETLVELDITYRELALKSGCPSYHRVGTVQTHSSFIKGIGSLVRREVIELH